MTIAAAVVFLLATMAGCSGGGNGSGNNLVPGNGGVAGSGGTTSGGGTSGEGGGENTRDGATTIGGSTGSGGVTGSGSANGGTKGSGGMLGSGGASGGAKGSGGVLGSGGASSGTQGKDGSAGASGGAKGSGGTPSDAGRSDSRTDARADARADARGDSADLAVDSPATLPSAPTGLLATGLDSQVVLSWAATAGATSYNVKRGTSSSGYTTIGTCNSPQYTDTGLTNGTTYQYVVSAVNALGESDNCSEVSATPTATHVSQDADGWTVMTPSTDTRTIHVSTSGNDSYDGLSPDFTTGTRGPKKTVSAGLALMRSGYPDWLLLRRGDSFREGLMVGTLSGRSESEPMLFSSYGTAIDRPILNTTINVWGGSHVTVSHLSVVQSKDSGNVNTLVYGKNILVEGCRMEGGSSGIATSGFGDNGDKEPSIDIRIRRNVFYENMFNIYIYNTNTLLFEENVLFPPPTTLNGSDMHAMYVTRAGNSNITVQNNLFLQDPALNEGDGIKMRPGGIARGNIVVGATWTSILMGACTDSSGACTGSNGPGIIDGNLIVDTTDNNAAIGYDARYLQSPIQITNNILLRLTSGLVIGGDNTQLTGNISVDAPLSMNMSSNNVTWQQNVFYGTISSSPLMYINDSLTGSKNFKATENRFYSTADPSNWFALLGGGSFANWKTLTGETGSNGRFSFVDAKRSLGTYNASLGGTATTRAFFDAAAKQSKYSWDKRYTAPAAIAYIREGLSITP